MEPLLLATAGLVAPAVATWWGSALLPLRGVHDVLSPGALWRVPTDGVALTFDDGPDPRWTPEILAVLAEHRAVATFFVVGERVARHPELVAEIAGAGHIVGNHTWSHPTLPRLGRRRIAAELDRCQRAVADILGTAPRFVRPPYGRRDVRFYRMARERGLRPVMWSLDSRDWLYRNATSVTQRIIGASNGDIVLLHDGQVDSSHTVTALQNLLAALADRGISTTIPVPSRPSALATAVPPQPGST